MPRSASIGDVARAANLSAATVSRHLNGRLHLPAATARRIEAAVAALGYRPNPHARSLSRGRAETIGLLLPDIANPFFARLAAAVEAAADAHGLGVMLCASLNKPVREIDYLARLRHHRLEGLLLATNHADDGALAAAINDAPGVVLIDEDVAGTRVPKVFPDNVQGGYLAGAHLLAAGHRRLAYIGGPVGLMSTQERRAGLERAVAEAGPAARLEADYDGDYTREHGEAAAAHLLDHHGEVTAVFAASDEILIGLLSAMRRRGLTAGRDLSIVTFDDAAPLELLEPPVTAVRQPVEAIGRRALDLILAPGGGAAKTERLPVTLIERASVGAPRQPARRKRKGVST